jgi:hypothetical protein
METKTTRRWLLPILAFAVLLTAWTGWLRAPSIRAPMWNVDETIHAAAARKLLEGGLMYRDVIDQRTPLTYYAFAAIFRVTGINNLVGPRIVLCGMIAATALGLFLIGRRIRQTGTGVWAALIFTAIANYLVFPGDTFAPHTEWFVILFTTAGALTFLWPRTCPSPRRSVAVGALFSLAFLSKQTALVDFVVPLITLAWLGATRTWPWRDVLRSAAGIAFGFTLVTGSVILVFVLLGGGSDLLFYTWTYNLRYYGPEVEWSQRVISCRWFFEHLVQLYPAAFVFGVVSLLVVAVRASQLSPRSSWVESRAADCFLLLWCGTSLFGAISSGRGFDHYFFQCMPPVAWLAAWLPGWLTHTLRGGTIEAPARKYLIPIAALALLALAVNVFSTPTAARKVPWLDSDPAYGVSEFIRDHSRPDEKIFVWGYNPDIYLYANRSPASRYLYCTFQTGLIPWTNLAPDKDTRYAVVPGAMDSLMSDLSVRRPRFIVDCGVGPHRNFKKYPLAKFEPLVRFVENYYVEIDPARYHGQGFRLFMLRDQPQPLSAALVNSDRHPRPYVDGPQTLNVGPNSIIVAAEASPNALRRLALVIDGAESAAVEFPAAEWMKFEVSVAFPAASTPHRLEAIAEWTDGTRTISSPIEAHVVEFGSTREQSTLFAIPRVSGTIPANGVRALLNPGAEWSNGTHFFQLHAPSLVRYTLPAGAVALHGHFGLPAGAYAPENKSPSDGAEFIVRVIPPGGTARVLVDRLLQPARQPGDRPVQNFRVPLEGLPAGSTLELEITPGPNGDKSSDWTFWSDVELESSS